MRSPMRISATIVLAMVTFAGSATAAPIAITNNSFETGSFVNDGNGTMVLPVGSTAITGWTVTADQLAWITMPNPWGLAPQDGTRFLDLTAYPAGAPFGGISQTLSTTIGNAYQLSYYLGTYTAAWGGPPVSILASAGGASQTCTVGTTSAQSTWTPCTMNFVAAGASTLLSFLGTQGFQYIGLDNVVVDDLGPSTGPPPSVPEPALLALLGLGAFRVSVRRYRRKR